MITIESGDLVVARRDMENVFVHVAFGYFHVTDSPGLVLSVSENFEIARVFIDDKMGVVFTCNLEKVNV